MWKINKNLIIYMNGEKVTVGAIITDDNDKENHYKYVMLHTLAEMKKYFEVYVQDGKIIDIPVGEIKGKECTIENIAILHELKKMGYHTDVLHVNITDKHSDSYHFIFSPKKGQILILTGTAGSGKDTICREFISIGFEKIISSTTRDIRVGEQDGREYHFISTKEFLHKLKTKKIFEHRTFIGLDGTILYGSEKISLSKDMNYIVILDAPGTLNYIKEYGKENCFVVHVHAPENIRYKRAVERIGKENVTKDFTDKWKNRNAIDKKDFSQPDFKEIVDFTVENSGNLNNTVEEILERYNAH